MSKAVEAAVVAVVAAVAAAVAARGRTHPYRLQLLRQ